MKLNLSIRINERAELHIETSSIEELDLVRAYCVKQGIVGVPGEAGAAPAEPAKAEKPAAAAAKTDKPATAAGKPAKAAAPAKTDAGPTIEEVTAQLTAVADKFGVPEALAMNKRFGVKKAGELKPEQYADYIKFAKHCIDDDVAPTASHEEAAEETDVTSLV